MKKFNFKRFIDKHYVLKESLLATFFTIIITLLVSFIPIKYEFSKAIRIDFLGFDIYDLYFSGRELPYLKRDSDIVIIEIAGDRESIARQINIIHSYSPAIIGIDSDFPEREDTSGNNDLTRAIIQSDRIVVGYRIKPDTHTKKETVTRNFFETGSTRLQSGYMNLFQDSFSSVRNYRPFYDTDSSTYLAFTSAILQKKSLEKYDELKNRKTKTEIINYSGSLESYTNLSKEQLLYSDSTGQLRRLLEGKTVLLGYFVRESPQTSRVLEDLWFSPVNKRISGKSFPDMYGVVIQANILSMVLHERYMTQASNVISYLIAGLLIFLFLYYMLSQYKKKQHPKHGKFLLIQFLLVLVVLFIFLMIFKWFWIKVPLLPIMIALVLCVELLGVYKNIALRMNKHKKLRYKTVFAHKHII
ncbi:MAG: CHASE2 domain-containing protein [Chitinophagales bacterium]